MEGDRGNSTEVIWFLAMALEVCAKVNYSWAGQAGGGRAFGRGGDFTAQKSQSAGVQSNCWGKTPRGWAVTSGELRAPLAPHLGSIQPQGEQGWWQGTAQPSQAAHAGKGFSGDLPGWFVVSKCSIAGCEEGNYSIFAFWTKEHNFWGVVCIL